jgi:WD40 repeat protein
MQIARLVVLLLSLSWPAFAQTQNLPILQLDTGGHQAILKSMAFTPDGKYIVSSGDDKVVRIWDWRAGKTVRAIRGQIDSGDEGKIFAMALSPDGRSIATGGFVDGDVVRVFDFASGSLKRLLKAHTDVTHTLSFSPDSKLLISGSSDLTAIIWDVASGRQLVTLKGHNGAIYGTGFTPDGARVVTASLDKTLRLWSVADGSLIRVLDGHSEQVFAVAVSPKSDLIASADITGEVRLWDGKTGRFIRVLGNIEGIVASVQFSPDGTSVLATCGGSGRCAYKQTIFDVLTGRVRTIFDRHDNIVRASAFSPDGQLVATGGGNDRAIFVWNAATGEPVATLKGTGQTVWAVAFSEDNRRIGWGQVISATANVNDFGPVQMSLRLPAADEALGEPTPITDQQNWRRVVTKFGNLSLRHKQTSAYGYNNILEIVQDGAVRATITRDSTNGLRHHSYTFTPDGKTVISGGNGFVTAYDLDGKVVGEFVGHESDVYTLAVSPNGKFLVTGAADQTVRLWDIKSRALLVTLYQGTDGAWVIWTPEGYYASSPNAESIIGWQINNGADKAADYVTANQLRSHFYRPDILARTISLASSRAAIQRSAGIDFSLGDLLVRKPPAFTIASPREGEHAKTTPADVRLQLDPSNEPIEAIDIFVNGRQVTTPELRSRAFSVPKPLERDLKVPIELGENKVKIVVRNKVGQTVRDLTLFYDRPGQLNAAGKLFVLAIGTDDYSKLPAMCGASGTESCNLRYAGNDARAFRDTLVKQMGPQFKQVVTRLLARGGDKPPTKANIEDALSEILGQAGPEDTTVLFIAGHGVNDARTSEYLFLPQDAELLSSGSWRGSSVVRWVLLQNALQNTQGRRLMFVDTCHSGGAYNARLINDATDANIIVFSATDTQTLSWELENLTHGVFTYALIRGLEGGARRKDGAVTMLGLAEYVSEEVLQLTTNKQQPTFNMAGARNFMLARQ